MNNLAIKIKNYKCFKDETGFDTIRRVNIIIGRNNVGKSSLLDVIEIVVSGTYEFDRRTWKDNQPPQIIFEALIPKAVVTQTFPANTNGGSIGGNHQVYGRNFIDRKIKWSKNKNGTFLLHCDDTGIRPSLSQISEYSQRLLNNMPIDLEKKVFRRLLAERDIVPEGATSTNLSINSNGQGITNVIQHFINSSSLPSELVELNILEALNEIFAHDANFTDIVCQHHSNNTWEIYLEEEYKGRIALSKSGSGLKTVMSVLACLFLVPNLESKPLGDYVFGFEELENNIHPALLRRLNDYIYKSSIENGFIYFLTTHSNVLIDQFSKQDDAQIIHITQKDSVAKCITAKTYIHSNGILDDLDVRASDLLQANGIIWVEGPSDRIYLNRWIALWSDNKFKEGSHYQIIFYGGRLLSHLSADAPEDIDASISILNTNRNAVILIDSDKRTQQSQINLTKQRIRDEFNAMNAMCWITKGKEIENYISASVVDIFLDVNDTSFVGRYDSFFDHIDSIKAGEGTKYNSKKPLLAEKLIHHMSKDNMQDALDINEQMENLYSIIKAWNS